MSLESVGSINPILGASVVITAPAWNESLLDQMPIRKGCRDTH